MKLFAIYETILSFYTIIDPLFSIQKHIQTDRQIIVNQIDIFIQLMNNKRLVMKLGIPSMNANPIKYNKSNESDNAWRSIYEYDNIQSFLSLSLSLTNGLYLSLLFASNITCALWICQQKEYNGLEILNIFRIKYELLKSTHFIIVQ